MTLDVCGYWKFTSANYPHPQPDLLKTSADIDNSGGSASADGSAIRTLDG